MQMQAQPLQNVIRRTGQYEIAIIHNTSSNQSHINLYAIKNLNINRAYTIKLNQFWNRTSPNLTALKQWFDSLEDLTKYIKSADINLVVANINTGTIDILIQPRKGRDKYVKIGVLQLQEVEIDVKMQLLWIIQKCNRKQQLSPQQALQIVRNIYKAFHAIMGVTGKGQNHLKKIDLRLLVNIASQLEVSMGLVEDCLQIQKIRIQGDLNRKYEQIDKQITKTIHGYNNQIKQLKQGSIRQNKKDISYYINTRSKNIQKYIINQFKITLKTNPTAHHPLLICGYPIYNSKIKFSIKIIRMKRMISVGIAKAKNSHKKTRLKKDQCIKFSNSGTFTYMVTKTKIAHGFYQGNTVTVCVDFHKAIITWVVNGFLHFSQYVGVIKNNSLSWVPFIQLTYQGDSIQWVV